jgi:hypothetical protein
MEIIMMSDRKVKVVLSVQLTLRVDEGVEVGEIIDELDYSFSDTTTKATIEDEEILDYEVIDSK